MSLHRNVGEVDVHVFHAFTYANAAARVAATGLIASDVGRVARQSDNQSFWVLQNHSPVTWSELTGISGLATHGATHAGNGTDPVPNATTAVAGLMSAFDKTVLDALMQGNVTTFVRNETGATIPKGKLVSVSGYSTVHSRPLVQLADKDDAAKRPAIGVLVADLANNTNASALTQGTIIGVDTSTFAVSDQLVLGTAGAFSKGPPAQSPFTGRVQNIGTISRVHATLGELVISLDGLEAVSADQVFALAGTNGTPSDTNRYVTNTDPRNTNARTPTAHAVAHAPGGTDPLATAAPGTVTFGGASEGTATSLARSDHAHALTVPGVPADITKAAASAGASANVARQDHKHDIETAAAVELTDSTNAEGAGTSLARAAHTHAHGTRGGGTLHALVVAAGAAGFQSGTDKSKVDGIAAQAAPGMLSWGNDSVTATTTTRYLTPWYGESTARTGPVQFRVTRAGRLRKLRIRVGVTAGNGNAIVYTVRVNGVATALSVSLASTSADGGPDLDEVVVADGDLVDIEVTKALAVGTSPSNIEATLEFAA